MKVVKPSATLLKEEDKIKLIERVGRTCYKSEDKITKDSAEKFVRGLMNRKHFAMIEHGNVVLRLSALLYEWVISNLDTAYVNKTRRNEVCIISGSFRAFRDMLTSAPRGNFSCLCIQCILNVLKDAFPVMFEDIYVDPDSHLGDEYCKLITTEELILLPISDSEVMKHIYHTVHFVCDRGVSHEFVRHRNCAFAQESTRYCNYNKNQFGGEVTFVEPFFWAEDKNSFRYLSWVDACYHSEEIYLELIQNGATPQEARSVLPNSLKTELIITCNEKEWQHIINLRYHGTTGAPHPQMKEVMSLAYPLLASNSGDRIK